MALFSFGKKKEKPPEVAAPVGKAPSAPPKLQTPPSSGSFPSIKPPQPTGLMPSAPIAVGAAMTQPMAVPRTGSTGLKPSKPGAGQSTRSTQRIVLPTPPGARPNSTKSLAGLTPGGRINLPIGMILRVLPTEVLASDIAEFEKTGAAATEIGLPMNSILGQLPSGKVEMTLQDLIPHFPPGYLQPTEAIASYLPTVVSLPLMDVVMRIPPDLLALRPDQKDVDASVINMADPFTEEILREQAETARRQSGANIIDESQAPHEEFVPSQNSTVKSVAPPRRPTVEPLAPSRMAATTLAAPPTPPGMRPPPSISGLSRPPGAPLPPAASTPAIPPSGPRTPSGQIPMPTRSSTPLPPRQTATVPPPVPAPEPPAVAANAPVPPVPRHTGPIPAPPPPRHTTSLPTVPRRTGTLASLSQSLKAAAAAAPVAAAAAGLLEMSKSTPEPVPAATPGAPDAHADDLQRLAALAMAQMGEGTETADEAVAKPTPVTSFNPPPEPEAALEPEPESESLITTPPPVEAAAPSESEPEEAKAPVEPEPVAEVKPEPVTAPEPEPEPTPVFEPIRAPVVPEPIRAPVAAEPIRAPVVAPMPPTPAPVAEEEAAPTGVAFNLNTCTVDDLVKNIPDVSAALAAAILVHREKIGSFSKIDELLDVPGMTKAAYTDLTGEAPPEATKATTLTLNELLGFPAQQHLSLKDVTDRIACWPDVTGCLLSQSSGLSLVGSAASGLDKEAVVAFAPRMFEAVNKSFSEVSGHETDALIIPSPGTSFHLFRNKELYLIIMSRLPLMPDRHVKVARFALAALSARQD